MKTNKENEMGIAKEIIKWLVAFIVFMAVFCVLLLGIVMLFVAKDLRNEVENCNPDTSMYCPEGR